METNTHPTTDAWKPIDYATYPGDVRSILTDGPKGPTLLGELMYPVTAEYDPATNKTRVGFSPVAPAGEVDR